MRQPANHAGRLRALPRSPEFSGHRAEPDVLLDRDRGVQLGHRELYRGLLLGIVPEAVLLPLLAAMLVVSAMPLPGMSLTSSA